MGSRNQCPEYLQEREFVRKWLGKSEAGKFTVDLMRRTTSPKVMQAILEDDDLTDWEELVKDNRENVLLAANCKEARESFDLARQARSTMGPPGAAHGKWSNFFSAPVGYVLRRQIETCDPEYWNDPKNVYREALKFPEWCKVPAEVIRGRLEQFLPKGSPVIQANGG